MNITVDELKNDKYKDGYRVVYFYPDNTHSIGAFCKTIEGFMVEFCEDYPIIDNEDVPEFISIDDLLSRYLESSKEAIAVAIYETDGKCVAKKDRNNSFKTPKK